MTTDIFQRLMHVNLFSTDGDDARLQKIRDAATALETSLAEDQALFLDAVLGASNPKAAPTGAAMTAAAAALEVQWNSYVSFYKSPPVNIFRAMLTSAVFAVADRNASRAQCLTLLLRNIVPRRQWDTEAPFWQEQAKSLDERHEAAAAAFWADNLNGPAAPLPNRPQPRAAKADRAKLEALLLSAVGPQASEGKPAPNPHWPSANEQWAAEFSKRAAPAIADAVDEAVAATIQGRLAVDKAVFEVLEQRLPNAEGVQRRARLLWWKEAKFSAHASRGYDQLSAATALILMAHDACSVTGALAPRSVEYFVRDAASAQLRAEPQSVKELVQELAGAEDRRLVGTALATSHAELLLGALKRAADGEQSGAAGVFPNAEKLTPGAFAVAVLREMQAMRALGAKT